jgi:hypothetical protein
MQIDRHAWLWCVNCMHYVQIIYTINRQNRTETRITEQYLWLTTRNIRTTAVQSTVKCVIIVSFTLMLLMSRDQKCISSVHSSSWQCHTECNMSGQSTELYESSNCMWNPAWWKTERHTAREMKWTWTEQALRKTSAVRIYYIAINNWTAFYGNTTIYIYKSECVCLSVCVYVQD